MKKLTIFKMSLILVAVVLANIYWGCIQTYPKEKLSAEDQIRIKQLELNQQMLLQKQSEETRLEIEALKKEIEQLKKQQQSP